MRLQLLADPTFSALTASVVPVGNIKGIVSPFVVYHIGTQLDTADVGGSTGYRTARVQYDCYSSLSYAEAKAVAKAVRGVWEHFQSATLPDADTTFVQGCLISQESDLSEIPTGSSSVEYRVMVEVTALYQES
jgi:hypothetical protein